MQIRRVDIENFRGIKLCTWLIPEGNRFICLIGPGDSGKTSILDAINFSLSDRWNLPILDTDFFNADIENPIKIRVTVTGAGPDIIAFDKLGMHLGGISEAGEIIHDPSEGFTPCITVQLQIDATLEPKWTAFRANASADDKQFPVSASVRRSFGALKVDDRIDNHLRWGNGSALGRLTEHKHASAVAVQATRTARSAVFEKASPELIAVSNDVRDQAQSMSSGEFKNLRPGLLPSAVGNGMLALHDGEVPLSGFGLGSRKLVGFAIQQLATKDHGILLADEIEQGLEPHRLVYLLRELRKSSVDIQSFASTHSPVCVEQLDLEDLAVVHRTAEGIVNVSFVPTELKNGQASLRSGPSSFLARKIIVGEGKTETGLLRGWLTRWDDEAKKGNRPPSAALGVAIRNGQGGSEAPRHGLLLSKLNYNTMIFVDNDDSDVDKAVRAAETAGCQVVRCHKPNAIEDEIAHAVSAIGLQAILNLAISFRGEETVMKDLELSSEGGLVSSQLIIDDWSIVIDSRKVIAVAAQGKNLLRKDTHEKGQKSRAWFKDEARAELLAGTILDSGFIADTHLETMMKSLRQFSLQTENFVEPAPGETMEKS